MKNSEIKTKLIEILDREGIKFEDFDVFPCTVKEFGDFSTNLLMKLKKIKLEVAEKDIIGIIQDNQWMKEHFEKIEERNNFLNFFLKTEIVYSVINEILSKKDSFGKIDAGKGEKVLIEFVSANPTGPLTIAHGRQAAFGEALSRILSFAGWKVTKEYYLNDCGRQIELLGLSLKAFYLMEKGIPAEIPEDGYRGQYMKEIAKRIPDGCENMGNEFFEEFAKNEILKTIRDDLERFNVHFDSWYSESKIRQTGMIEKIISFLIENGLVYEKDGAIWFASSKYGDDKDRVLRKKDMSYTYLAPDIAYHNEKIKRGYDLLINLWGPDHAGYIGRIKAAIKALGFDPEKLMVIIVQLTTLYRGKEKISMSTRKGQFISLRQLMDEVGPDAAKFFFIFRKAESHLDFDLELAKKKSDENPVYYIQYAYVRTKHILSFAREKGIEEREIANADLSLLKEEIEIELLKKLRIFPQIIEQAARTFDVSKIPAYLLDLAGNFHSYYQKIRIVEENKKVSFARLALVKSIFIILGTCLDILAITKPEKM